MHLSDLVALAPFLSSLGIGSLLGVFLGWKLTSRHAERMFARQRQHALDDLRRETYVEWLQAAERILGVTAANHGLPAETLKSFGVCSTRLDLIEVDPVARDLRLKAWQAIPAHDSEEGAALYYSEGDWPPFREAVAKLTEHLRVTLVGDDHQTRR
jgi:hypothetical protein